MPLRFLVFHLAAAMASMKRVVLDLNTRVSMIKPQDKKNISVKEIVTKFNAGKTQMNDILKAKLEISVAKL
jgi:hypothetical protein